MNMTSNERSFDQRKSAWWRPTVLAGGLIASVGMAGIVNGQSPSTVQHDGQSFPVMQASEAAALFNFPAMEARAKQSEIAQVAHRSCGCGDTGCGGSCGSGSCGGGYSSGVTMSGALTGGDACSMGCPTCEPYCYIRAESVLMRRQGIDNFTRSRNFSLDDYDFEFAPRITIGTVPDCVSGNEFSFTGPLQWRTSETLLNTNGLTQLFERIPGQINPIPITEQDIAFTFLYDPEAVVDPNADPLVFTDNPGDAINIQRQTYESNYWSLETSRTTMAWDVAKVLFGPRYVNFEETYTYTASNGAAAADNGALVSDVSNTLIGLQVGVELFTPITKFGSTYMRARAGGYLNQSEARVSVVDQDEVLYGMSDDDIGLAGMIEISNGIQYQLGEMLGVHAGTELWYVTEVATAESNIPQTIGSRASTRSINNSDDVLFVGFGFGATLKF